MDTDLRAWLRHQRELGVSFNEIVGRLREQGAVVSPEAVRKWCERFGIDGERRAS